MRKLGIRKVFYSNEKDNKVDIGNQSKYFHDYNYDLFKEMKIEKILGMPFYYTTLDMLCDYHDSGEHYILNEVKRDGFLAAGSHIMVEGSFSSQRP